MQYDGQLFALHDVGALCFLRCGCLSQMEAFALSCSKHAVARDDCPFIFEIVKYGSRRDEP